MSTGTESALALSKLGGDSGDRGSRPRAPPMLDVLGFLRLLFRDGTEALETDDSLRSTTSPPGTELADSGLLGFDRMVCRGGCGKAPMLTVFRSVFPCGTLPTGTPSAVTVGIDGEVRCLGEEWGSAEDDTVRTGAPGRSELEGLRGEATPMLECRVFGTGREGSGPVGGAIEGRDGRGSVVLDMLTDGAFQRAEDGQGQLCGSEGAVDALLAPGQICFSCDWAHGTMSGARFCFTECRRQTSGAYRCGGRPGAWCCKVWLRCVTGPWRILQVRVLAAGTRYRVLSVAGGCEIWGRAWGQTAGDGSDSRAWKRAEGRGLVENNRVCNRMRSRGWERSVLAKLVGDPQGRSTREQGPPR